MKNVFSLFAAMLCIAIAANAKVWTVNNNTTITNLPSAGQFTTINAAIAAAATGDTIYISGSPTTYADFTLSTKKLVLIGSGYNPDNQFDYKTTIGSSSIVSGPSTAGSQFIGLVITQLQLQNTNNIKISRCQLNLIQLVGTVSNVEITNNIILSQIIINNNENITINNNIIGLYIQSSNKSSVLVTNNVFHSSSSGFVFNVVTNIVFTNNVLINMLPSGCSFCAMDHNMASNPAANFDYSSTNSTSSNLVGVSPLYNVTASPNSVSLNNIYVLQAGSPAIGAGSDGTDAGITGGPFPFDVVKKAYPPIPQITLMNMTKSNVPQGGDIQFNVKVRTQN